MQVQIQNAKDLIDSCLSHLLLFQLLWVIVYKVVCWYGYPAYKLELGKEKTTVKMLVGQCYTFKSKFSRLFYYYYFIWGYFISLCYRKQGVFIFKQL